MWRDGRILQWRTCPPDGSACTPLPDGAYVSRQECTESLRICYLAANPGPAAPGTVFEAAFETDGVVTTRRTSAWLGSSTSSAPPALGEAVVGRLAAVMPGSWEGGWAAAPEIPASQLSYLDLSACRGADGVDCLRLDADKVLPSRVAGWYLFVNDHRYFSGRWSYLFPIAVAGSLARPHRFERLWPGSSTSRLSAPVQSAVSRPSPPWRLRRWRARRRRRRPYIPAPSVGAAGCTSRVSDARCAAPCA